MIPFTWNPGTGKTILGDGNQDGGSLRWGDGRKGLRAWFRGGKCNFLNLSGDYADVHTGEKFIKMYLSGVPAVVQWFKNLIAAVPPITVEVWVRSAGHSCGSDLILGPGTSICHGCGHNLKNIYIYIHIYLFIPFRGVCFTICVWWLERGTVEA